MQIRHTAEINIRINGIRKRNMIMARFLPLGERSDGVETQNVHGYLIFCSILHKKVDSDKIDCHGIRTLGVRIIAACSYHSAIREMV